jgi:hypothetical protein
MDQRKLKLLVAMGINERDMTHCPNGRHLAEHPELPREHPEETNLRLNSWHFKKFLNNF